MDTTGETPRTLSDKERQEALLALEDVSFAYPATPGTAEPSAAARGTGRPVLRHVTFALNAGQKVGLYGANGSGKTTLLRCITGLERIDAGHIWFHGRPVRSEKDFRPLRCALGYVLQNADDQLFFPTVVEDVAFGPLNLGLPEDEARERARQTLERLGLAGFEERLTHRLSGGEKKLVTLACVLAMQPEALLLDEPTAGLDAASQARLTELLTGLDTARITISHDWDFLTRVSSEFCTLEDGLLSWKAPLVTHTHTHAHPHGDVRHTHEG